MYGPEPCGKQADTVTVYRDVDFPVAQKATAPLEHYYMYSLTFAFSFPGLFYTTGLRHVSVSVGKNGKAPGRHLSKILEPTIIKRQCTPFYKV